MYSNKIIFIAPCECDVTFRHEYYYCAMNIVHLITVLDLGLFLICSVTGPDLCTLHPDLCTLRLWCFPSFNWCNVPLAQAVVVTSCNALVVLLCTSSYYMYVCTYIRTYSIWIWIWICTYIHSTCVCPCHVSFFALPDTNSSRTQGSGLCEPNDLTTAQE